MNKLCKCVLATLLVIAMMLSFAPTVHAAPQTFVTVTFDMPEGCTYPIYIELYHRENSQQQECVLTASSGYSHVFTIEPGRFFISASVEGDNWSDYPIDTESIYEVSEGSNLLIELKFSDDVAKKLQDESQKVTQPTEPSEPEKNPDVSEPTEPEKNPVVETPSKPTEPEVTEPEATKPSDTETPEEPATNWGPVIRGGFFVFAAAVVALVVIIKKKRDQAALGGEDDD